MIEVEERNRQRLGEEEDLCSENKMGVNRGMGNDDLKCYNGEGYWRRELKRVEERRVLKRNWVRAGRLAMTLKAN